MQISSMAQMATIISGMMQRCGGHMMGQRQSMMNAMMSNGRSNVGTVTDNATMMRSNQTVSTIAQTVTGIAQMMRINGNGMMIQSMVTTIAQSVSIVQTMSVAQTMSIAQTVSIAKAMAIVQTVSAISMIETTISIAESKHSTFLSLLFFGQSDGNEQNANSNLFFF